MRRLAVKRALTNLVDNALHYGERVSVALVPGDGEVTVCVRDDGPGIPEAVRATLFEPFVSTKRGGQGLGLALVAKLVADQGGLIECDSRPGRTVFRLLLAAAPAGAAEGVGAGEGSVAR